jgi:hypothetical protein
MQVTFLASGTINYHQIECAASSKENDRQIHDPNLPHKGTGQLVPATFLIRDSTKSYLPVKVYTLSVIFSYKP